MSLGWAVLDLGREFGDEFLDQGRVGSVGRGLDWLVGVGPGLSGPELLGPRRCGLE